VISDSSESAADMIAVGRCGTSYHFWTSQLDAKLARESMLTLPVLGLAIDESRMAVLIFVQPSGCK